MSHVVECSQRDATWIQAILAASPDGALLVNEEGVVTHANSVLEEMFDWSIAELAGRPVEQLVPERSRSRHAEEVASYLRDPIPIAIGLRKNLYGRHKDGREIPVQIGLNPIQLHDKTYVLGVIRDISARVQLEDRLRLVIEAAPVAMLMASPRREITMANSKTEEVFGYTRAEMLGRPVDFLAPERLGAKRTPLASDFLADPRPGHFGQVREVVGKRRDGSLLSLEIALSNLEMEGETHVLAAVIDVTGRKRMEREFSAAREIQQAMLPHQAPELFGFDIAGASIPAHAAGGDFFDYIPQADHKLAVVVGDTSGHGIGPALLAATTKSYLKALARTHANLADVLKAANQLLIEESPDEQFVALMVVQLDPQIGAITYGGAGHDGYLFDRAGNLKQHLDSRCPPLGLVQDQEFEFSSRIPLKPADIILIATDGVYEAAAPDNEQFGHDRLFATIREHRQRPAQEIVDAVMQAVRDFAQAAPQEDDMTIVAVKARE